MPVVDASVLAEYLGGGPSGERAGRRLLDAQEALWAPHLVDAEVGHVIRRAVSFRELSPERGRAALVDLSELPLKRIAHVGLLGRAWELRANLSFYDALYVALAEGLELPLLTLDARLGAAPGHRARVDVLA
jgi:predicted nucleic acid-binding protein